MTLNNVMPCPLQMAQIFNEINAEIDGLIEFVMAAKHDRGGAQASIKPHIDQMVETLNGIDYSNDFKTSAHAFAIKASDAFVADPVILLDDDNWSWGDQAKVRGVAERAKLVAHKIAKQDTLFSGLAHRTDIILTEMLPTLNDDATINTLCAKHAFLSFENNTVKDQITLNTHPDALITNKVDFLSAFVHELFHGLETVRLCSCKKDETDHRIVMDAAIIKGQQKLNAKARVISHRLYEALPQERLAREVQAKFEAPLKRRRDPQPFFRR